MMRGGGGGAAVKRLTAAVKRGRRRLLFLLPPPPLFGESDPRRGKEGGADSSIIKPLPIAAHFSRLARLPSLCALRLHQPRECLPPVLVADLGSPLSLPAFPHPSVLSGFLSGKCCLVFIPFESCSVQTCFCSLLWRPEFL